MGTRIAMAIDSGEVDGVLERVHDAEPEKARALAGSLARRPTVVENHHLLSSGPGVDLVVEAASQDAVRSAALSVIQNRKDMVVMSVAHCSTSRCTRCSPTPAPSSAGPYTCRPEPSRGSTRCAQ